MGWKNMPGDREPANRRYLLDTNTISQIFRAYYRDQFPSFWERFDEMVRTGAACSVSAVARELENARRGNEAVNYLRRLNRNFFADPAESEQVLVREMINDPDLSAANNRWLAKARDGTEDADPYLIARARNSLLLDEGVVIVTEENPDNSSSIPAVCQRFNVHYINLQGMMTELGWRF